MCRSRESMPPEEEEDDIWVELQVDTGHKSATRLPERHPQQLSQSSERMEDSRAPIPQAPFPARHPADYTGHVDAEPANGGRLMAYHQLGKEYLPAMPQFSNGSPVHHFMDPGLDQAASCSSSDLTDLIDHDTRMNCRVDFEESSLRQSSQYGRYQTMTSNERRQSLGQPHRANYGSFALHPHGSIPQGGVFDHSSTLTEPSDQQAFLRPEHRGYVPSSVSPDQEGGVIRPSRDFDTATYMDSGSDGWHDIMIHQTAQMYGAHDVALHETTSAQSFVEVHVGESTPLDEADQTRLTVTDARPQGQDRLQLPSREPSVSETGSPRSMTSPRVPTSPSLPPSLCCGEPGCAAEFNGKYRHGNLARHRRMRHRGHPGFICVVQSCSRSFRRQDARLKHYRRHHPELADDPVPRSSGQY